MKIKIVEGDKEKTRFYKMWTLRLAIMFVISITLSVLFGWGWIY